MLLVLLHSVTCCLQTCLEGFFDLTFRLAFHIVCVLAIRQEISCINFDNRFILQLRAQQPHLDTVSEHFLHKHRIPVIEVLLDAKDANQIQILALCHESFLQFLLIPFIQRLHICDNSKQISGILRIQLSFGER